MAGRTRARTIELGEVVKAKARYDEDVVWTLHKGDRTAEARIGTVASSGGQPELRSYATAESKAEFVMLFCQVVKDTRAARHLAAEKRAEFETQGWLPPHRRPYEAALSSVPAKPIRTTCRGISESMCVWDGVSRAYAETRRVKKSIRSPIETVAFFRPRENPS